jgi:hypothetical protein
MIRNANGPKVIIVSRCNANETQYKRYLEMCFKLPSIVTFITPQNIDMLYVMVSLSGIINRSKTDDMLMLGNIEMPIEQVVKFTVDNFKTFVPATKINTFQTHTHDSTLQIDTDMTNEEIIQFVKTNHKKLHSMRMPIETIGVQIIDIIQKTIDGINDDIVIPKNPTYIGMAVNESDYVKVLDFVNQFVPTPTDGYTTYIHHCTQVFIGKSVFPASYMDKLVKPGKFVSAEIDALIIRKSDMASAFRVKNLSIGQLAHQAHITAKIPSHEKPMCSNSFVGLTDDSVTVIEFNYKLNLRGFWQC